MNILYIPEIGDSISLTADWTFNLHNEYRNRDVWKALGCALHPDYIAWDKRRAEIVEELEAINRRRSKLAPRGGFLFRPFESDADQARYNELHNLMRAESDITVPVAMPVGTVLAIDRIYIRKGASGYSSVSFFVLASPLDALTPAKKGGGFKKGRRRFWAKLHDVNRIQFSKVASAEAA